MKENSDTTQAKAVVPIREYVPLISFPQRLYKHKLDKQFSKFIEVFKNVQINISFADALAQMLNYTKFMKEILTNKRKLEDYETVMLTEECSVRLQNKLPLSFWIRGVLLYLAPYEIDILNMLYAILVQV